MVDTLNFEVLDHISESGESGKVNDDWLAYDKRVAIVADGATGLGDEQLIPDAPSDAQWIAKTLCERMVDAKADQPVRDLVLEVIMDAKAEVTKFERLENIPRYAWPAASYIMARLQNEMLEISGLGDCGAYVRFKDGYVDCFSAMPMDREAERNEAASDLGKIKREVENIRTPEVIASLRKKRALNNTDQSGVWTIGLEEEAANRVMTIAVPSSEICEVLLMSDGFSALSEVYQKYDAAGLLNAAKDSSLSNLYGELRHIEHDVDPKAIKYPRYKRSDDSTAILLKLCS